MSAISAITQYTQLSNGIRIAYRRFGLAVGIPLVCHTHFRCNMDHWDPLLLDALAAKREVILFDAPGVGRSGGEVPSTFQGWANDMIAFIRALELEVVDLFGFSMGAKAVQMVALTEPTIARKLVLAGCQTVVMLPEPLASDEIPDPKYVVQMAGAETVEDGREAFRLGCFRETERSHKAEEEYWRRLQSRTIEPPMLGLLPWAKGASNQRAAVAAAVNDKGGLYDRLSELKMPVLVANGDEDRVTGISRSWELFLRLPNAQLVMYPRSGHGFLWEYPEMFGEQIDTFLNTDAFD